MINHQNLDLHGFVFPASSSLFTLAGFAFAAGDVFITIDAELSDCNIMADLMDERPLYFSLSDGD